MKNNSAQTSFLPAQSNLLDLTSPYFTQQLITYIGNKRRLLPFLHKIFLDIEKEMGSSKLVYFDGFSGSGVVSRLLKYHAKKLYSNDFEDYTKTINSAYLANKSAVDVSKLQYWIDYLNKHKLDKLSTNHFIRNNYSPKDDNHIRKGERVFYTSKNATIIDNLRYLIDKRVPPKYKGYCLANLLIEASIHTNTSGVFKGFHKKGDIGHFGGKGENALTRILKEISLKPPVFGDVNCDVVVTNNDVNVLAPALKDIDVAYFDPPYNQHPYGSNYFMLNLINAGVPGEIQDGVSGIAKEWKRSAYNKRAQAIKAMDSLIAQTKARYIVISYNNEGIIPVHEFRKILNKYGDVKKETKKYNTYRGSRNLRNRNIHVEEVAWILKKR